MIISILPKIKKVFSDYALEKFCEENTNYDAVFNYELLMAVSSFGVGYDSKWSILVSASWLSNSSRKEVLSVLLPRLKASLSANEYNYISRVTLISSGDPFTVNARYFKPLKEDFKTLENIEIGGLLVENGFIFRIPLLDKLERGKVIALKIKNSSPIKAGVIRFEKDEMVYFTEKGLSEFFSKKPMEIDEMEKSNFFKLLKLKSKKELIKNGYIAKIKISKIEGLYEPMNPIEYYNRLTA